MALSPDDFVQNLTGSGLMTDEEVATFIDALPNNQKPADAEGLAKKLVADKKLTPFQAQQIWKGKGKSLVLWNYVISEKLGEGRETRRPIRREIQYLM